MRRRDMISGIAALLASPAVAEENIRLPPELPDGTRQIARFADLPNKRRLLQLADRPPNYETPVEAFTDTVTPNDRFFCPLSSGWRTLCGGHGRLDLEYYRRCHRSPGSADDD